MLFSIFRPRQISYKGQRNRTIPWYQHKVVIGASQQAAALTGKIFFTKVFKVATQVFIVAKQVFKVAM